jgi:ABC-type nitrate/sulfonate/bicarbonate transport system permease component
VQFSRGIQARLIDFLIGMASLVVIGVVWEYLVQDGQLNDYFFPPPSKIAHALETVTTSGFPRGVTIFSHIEATLLRIIKGYAMAVVLGIPAGLFVGSRRFLDQAIAPLATFARSVATISLLPLMITWFGVGELSRVLLVFYGCFWVIFTNAAFAVKTINPQLIRAAQMLGASRIQIFFQVMLPASLPRIFAGMKIALGLAFLYIIAVELIGTIEGLGALINEARTYYRTDTMMVGMLMISLFGFSLAKGLDLLEKLQLPWAESLEEVER